MGPGQLIESSGLGPGDLNFSLVDGQGDDANLVSGLMGVLSATNPGLQDDVLPGRFPYGRYVLSWRIGPLEGQHGFVVVGPQPDFVSVVPQFTRTQPMGERRLPVSFEQEPRRDRFIHLE